MRFTEYDEADSLLNELLYKMQSILGERLVGLYLYGSLAWGDFDAGISDIDLLAATRRDITRAEFSHLNQMHHQFAEDHPDWADRIEVAYMSQDALRTFKRQRSQIAIISPGEPFHIKEAGHDWLINWYLVRERGRTIFGPDPRELIDPISRGEFIQGVKKQAMDWHDWVSRTKDSIPYQGYAVLTACRALYACVHGEQVSKKRAAEWAIQEYPQKAQQIANALLWRKQSKDPPAGPELTYPETIEFVDFMIDEIVRRCG